MKKCYVPCYNLNVPGGGLQQPVTLRSNDPVYSTYTGNLIGYGPLSKGIPTDAPHGNIGYGKDYHVVEFNPANQSFMAHGVFFGTPTTFSYR